MVVAVALGSLSISEVKALVVVDDLESLFALTTATRRTWSKGSCSSLSTFDALFAQVYPGIRFRVATRSGPDGPS